MQFRGGDGERRAEHARAPQGAGPGVGKRSLVDALVQRMDAAASAPTGDRVQAAAAHGVTGPSTQLPFRAQIQRLFGRHDVSGVQAHVGGAAAEGAGAMAAHAYASGERVAFATAPDLQTAAHEAAHVVQQRGGVPLAGGIGEAGDDHERHADEVADRVVRGESAEALLDRYAGGGGGAPKVQRRIDLQHPQHAAAPASAAQVLAFLGAIDQATQTNHHATVTGDPTLRAALDVEIAAPNAVTFTQAQAAALVARLQAGATAAAAPLTQAGWGAADIRSLTGALAQGGVASAAIHALFQVANFAVRSHAMIGTWTAANLGTLSAAALGGGATDATYTALLGVNGFAASSAALVAANWTVAQAGELCGRLQVAQVADAAIGALLATANFAARSQLLLAVWTVAQTASFVATALATGTVAATLVQLLGTQQFAARAQQMVAGGWSHADLGTYLGRALQNGATDQTLSGLLGTNGVAASSSGMRQGGAGWSSQQTGELTGEMLRNGVAANVVHGLFATANFPARSFAMTAAQMTAPNVGAVTAGAIAEGMAANDYLALISTANFPAAAQSLIAANWTAVNAGKLCGAARQAGLAAADLTAFLGTQDVPTRTRALFGRDDWTATVMGQTIAHVKAAAGAPDDTQLSLLLARARTCDLTAANVRRAASHQNTGNPDWDQVNQHVPTFHHHWVGSHANDGMDGGVVDSVPVFAGTGNPAHRVALQLQQDRINHVENGHTFEHNKFTFANCTRSANLTFYAPGTNVPARMGQRLRAAATRTMAKRVARNGGFRHSGVGGDMVGVERRGAEVAAVDHRGPTRPVDMTQCYPLAGTQITDAALVAIGRLFGEAL